MTYVADTAASTIRKISPVGLVTTLAGKYRETGSVDGLGEAARFFNPTGIAVDQMGNVYVADSNNASIRKISPAGQVITLAGNGIRGSVDGIGVAASFYRPYRLTIDNSNCVYVSDYYYDLSGIYVSNIRKINPSGLVSTFAGRPGVIGSMDGYSFNASFLNPAGIAADKIGNVYVADSGNQTIRKISLGR